MLLGFCVTPLANVSHPVLNPHETVTLHKPVPPPSGSVILGNRKCFFTLKRKMALHRALLMINVDNEENLTHLIISLTS